MNYFLGIDIGTTNVKLALFDANWEAHIVEEKEIKTYYPKSGYCEQNAVEIAEISTGLLKKVIQGAKAKSLTIDGIGLSTAMHSFLPVNDEITPLANLVIWSDTRAIQISESLKKNSTVSKYFEKSNVPMHPMLPLTKWIWFNQYSAKKKSPHKVISIKEYLIHKWFGELVIDVGLAGSTGYFDIKKNDWNYELLSYLKLDSRQLPEIKPSTYVLKNWKESLTKEIGTTELPPMVLGSSDGCLANMAAGVVDKTKASLTIGTSGAVRTAYTKPSNQGKRLFCYPMLKDYFVVGGAINNGGNALEWFRRNMSPNEENFWGDFDEHVRTIRPGAEGLFFLPYLFGERAPLWDPSLRGAYVGISNNHTNRHLLRATVEGIGFALKHIFKLIDARPNTIKMVVADGGFTKSRVWVQIICDMLGVEIICPEQSFGAAKGAAMLSKMILENKAMEDLLSGQIVTGEIFKPKKANKDFYDELFITYLNASSLINQWVK